MSLRVKLPKNVLTEIFSNWEAWNLGYIKKLIQEAEVEEEIITDTEFETLFNDLVNTIETEWSNFLTQGQGETIKELDALTKLVEPIFMKRLKRFLRIQG